MSERESKANPQQGGQDTSVTGVTASGSRLSRRRFTGAGVGVPVVLALANRPAFGAICTPSGFVSSSPENPSGVRHVVNGCGGLSPGAWKNPDAGNGDGSRAQWIAAGYYPNPRQEGNSSPGNSGNKGGGPGNGGGGNYNDPPGTLFDTAFGTAYDLGTMHDVLLNMPGSLEFHAVAGLLNAHTFGYMEPYDFVGLYRAVKMGAPYTTLSGVEVFMTESQLKDFIEQTYH